MKTFVIISSVVVLGGIAAYLLLKRNTKKVSELKQDKVEKLTLHYVKEYFVKQGVSLKDNKPVMVLIKESNDYGIVFEEGFKYFALTYYNESKGEILEDNTLIVATKEIDSNLKDAFGDKEMIVLN